jgi:hypothetical protein
MPVAVAVRVSSQENCQSGHQGFSNFECGDSHVVTKHLRKVSLIKFVPNGKEKHGL